MADQTHRTAGALNGTVQKCRLKALQTASVADENSKSAYRHSCENSSSHPSGCRHLYPEIPSFPRKWESRNEKQQEFIGNNRNRTDWIPACAGMARKSGLWAGLVE
ncbi:TPA: hypothetical protein ACFLEE_002003 [Neisseria gonorrhoeae]